MNKEKFYTYFEQFHGPVTQSTNGYYTATCPFCGKEKLAFNPAYGIVKCWRGCFRGFIVDFIKEYHRISYFEAHELIDNQETSGIHINKKPISSQFKEELLFPVGFTPILFGDTVLGNRARKYLLNRGFDLNYLDRIGIGYVIEHHANKDEDFFGYIIIPFKCRSKLVYYIGRDFLGNQMRYKNPPRDKFNVGKTEMFFNEEALELQDKIYLVEGWACAATIGPAGVSMQGSSMSTIQKNNVIRSDVKEVVLIPDAGFYTNGLSMAEPLILEEEKQVKVLNLSKFYARGLGKDVNEIGRDTIFNLEQETPYFTMKTLFHEKMKHSNRQLYKL